MEKEYGPNNLDGWDFFVSSDTCTHVQAYFFVSNQANFCGEKLWGSKELSLGKKYGCYCPSCGEWCELKITLLQKGRLPFTL